MDTLKRVIYFRRLPSPDKLHKLKTRFNLSPITVNGLSVATIGTKDIDVFQKCIERGFFEVRNITIKE